ncbi:MAG TPA: YggS family pyridoxal phosphate-dependent enzyme [Thermoanaerobaculia bacterium]|nr:YggS family pyridoxal phosphate-dependent enzyme [Thermoanaerobaculia bacterium]
MSGVADRLAEVERRIASACARAGRRRADLTLVGVTKTHPPETLLEAWEAGLHLFGENRVQEAAEKVPHLPRETEWHLIGPLQSNKVRPALDLFRTIHSIDRPKIAHAVDAEAARRGVEIAGFLEVNLAGEETKHGFPLADFAETVAPLAGLHHLKIRGLMAIPPLGGPAEASRSWFRQLRELRDELALRPEWAGFPGWLSMGMSDDFEVAIEEGASHVRIGTAIFGRR